MTDTNERKECCEKCVRESMDAVTFEHFSECKNPSCPCHTTPRKDDAIEEIVLRIIGITERGDDRDWEPQIAKLITSFKEKVEEEERKRILLELNKDSARGFATRVYELLGAQVSDDKENEATPPLQEKNNVK